MPASDRATGRVVTCTYPTWRSDLNAFSMLLGAGAISGPCARVQVSEGLERERDGGVVGSPCRGGGGGDADLGHALDELAVPVREVVRVDGQRHRHARVAEHRAHVVHRRAGGDQVGGERVPQIIEPELREAGSADEAVEDRADLVGPDRGAGCGLRAAALRSEVAGVGEDPRGDVVPSGDEGVGLK